MIELNLKRLLCPMPVIKLQQAASEQPDGTVIKMVCTDPGVKQDVPAWCRVHGHEVQSISESEEVIIIEVKVVAE